MLLGGPVFICQYTPSFVPSFVPEKHFFPLIFFIHVKTGGFLEHKGEKPSCTLWRALSSACFSLSFLNFIGPNTCKRSLKLIKKIFIFLSFLRIDVLKAVLTRWKCLFLPQYTAKNSISRLPFVRKCELDGKRWVSLRNKVATTLVAWQGAAVWRDYVHSVSTVRLNVRRKKKHFHYSRLLMSAFCVKLTKQPLDAFNCSMLSHFTAIEGEKKHHPVSVHAMLSPFFFIFWGEGRSLPIAEGAERPRRSSDKSPRTCERTHFPVLSLLYLCRSAVVCTPWFD